MDPQRPAKITAKWVLSLSEEELAYWLNKASDAYYNTGTPLFTDNQFDAMKERLEDLNPEHPFLQQVGAPIAAIAEYQKVKLPYYMGSMDKIKNEPKDLEKWKKKYTHDVIITDKLDGLSVMLYKDQTSGEWKLATRGDGHTGQDVSHLIGLFRGIPRRLDEAEVAGCVAVRGEVLLSKKAWAKLVKAGDVEAGAAGSDEGPDADGGKRRAVVAGVLHSKTPNKRIAKALDFCVFEYIEKGGPLRPSEQLQKAAELGFFPVYSETLTHDQLSIDALLPILRRRREEGEYTMDGLVIYENQPHKRITSGNPKYAFAFKSMDDMKQVEVVVKHVEWNVSKDRLLKPIVHIHPTSLNGVKISKATGFNGKFIEDNVIGPGARVVIVRSGDVIPHIVSVVSAATSGKAMMPETPYLWNASHVDIMVDEQALGESQGEMKRDIQLKELTHFFSVVNVKGVSGKTIERLYDAGYTTIPLIRHIQKDQLLKIDGIKDKSAQNILTSLKEAFDAMDLVTCMIASNAFGRGFGEKKLTLILEALPSIVTHAYTPTLDELTSLKGIEEKTAVAFLEHLPQFRQWVHKNQLEDIIRSLGARTSPVKEQGKDLHEPLPELKLNNKKVEQEAVDVVADDTPLTGKHVLFTGFRDKDLEKEIRKRGGDVVDSISKAHILVTKVADTTSTKAVKAKDMGIPIYVKEEFMKTYI